jgi:adenosylmethionine-8-amino-7-oxononanoate aminotransferase
MPTGSGKDGLRRLPPAGAILRTVSSSAEIHHAAGGLRESARRHLWMHFSALGRTGEPAPVIVRGEGCHVWDDEGRRYLDGLSSLFCVNAGHGRGELGDAAAAQARELGYSTTWGSAHPRAIELAERVAGLAPDGLERVFFTSGGSEAVESALKLARAHHGARGELGRTKIIARELAYHGTTMGALSLTGLESIRTDFAPLLPGVVHVPPTWSYGLAPGADPLAPADAIETAIVAEGPETVAAVILEPVQNSGGCLVPPPGYFTRVREICDRHGVLLISDDTICSWGRLGTWFGAQRFDYRPDLITTAKGLTSAYAPMGAMIVSDRVAEPFTSGAEVFAHGFTFGGHPVAAAVALANLDILERERLLDRVLRHEAALAASLDGLRDLPLIGDVRGAGYFWGIELVRDVETAQRFDPAEARDLVAWLGRELHRAGLICRAADRGHPVIQLAPPLIAGPAEFAEMEAILRRVLGGAAERFGP